jgi:hypothetical protein
MKPSSMRKRQPGGSPSKQQAKDILFGNGREAFSFSTGSMTMKAGRVAVTVCLTCGLLGLAAWLCFANQSPVPRRSVADVVVYSNDFNGPVGSTFPEWTSSPITYFKTVTGVRGSLPEPVVATVESPNHKQRFLGEFGGPPIGSPGDPDWNRTRVDQTVSLSLDGLGPHTLVTVVFDLYVLKSWDGNSPQYGPDRFTLRITDGPVLLDTTFSNNPKVQTDGSYQNYPSSNSEPASNTPQTGAVATATLGYNNFFTDSIYHFSFTFSHTASTLTVEFASSLFEGKGTEDESWGLDNVVIRMTPASPADQ